MFNSLHFITSITRNVVAPSATTSRRTFYSEWRNLAAYSLQNNLASKDAFTSCCNGRFNNAYPRHFIFRGDSFYYSKILATRCIFTTSGVLLDSKFTRKKDSNFNESLKVKQTDDEKIKKTTSAINQRAAGAILTQLTSIPNLLTLSRIAVTPYLSYLLITHYHTKQASHYVSVGIDASSATAAAAESILLNTMPIYALSLFLLMGFTDFLDGFIARKYPSTATVLGTYLDPIADKIFISTMSLTLWYTETLPGMVVGLWIARDVCIVAAVYYMVKKETIKRINSGRTSNDIAVMDPQNTPLKVQASLLSKINTTLQIGLIALGIAGEIPAVNINADLMMMLCGITVGTTVGSSLSYLTSEGSAFRKSGNK